MLYRLQTAHTLHPVDASVDHLRKLERLKGLDMILVGFHSQHSIPHWFGWLQSLQFCI